MRILNVGDFNWMTGREPDTANLDLFAIRSKLGAAAVRAGHYVVEFSDRAVRRRSSGLRWRAPTRRAVGPNQAFLQLVDELRPDLVLLHNADELSAETLQACRGLAPGVALVDINIDPLPDPKTQARLGRHVEMVDAAFVTTAGEALAAYASARRFVAYMPNPVDAAVETGRAFEQPQPSVQLIFPANDDAPRRIGSEWLAPSMAAARIADALPDLRLSAPGLTEPKRRGIRYIDALADSRAGWAFSRYNDQPLYASDRMAHMLGNGLLTFVDAAAGFDRFYSAQEAVFYRDLDDLIARLRRMIADDAEACEIARRGWSRTWAVFDASRVFGYLLDQLYRDGGARDYEWPCDRWRRP